MQHALVVPLSVSRFRGTPRKKAERRLAELRYAVSGSDARVVLVVEDLTWAAEFWAGRRPPPSCSRIAAAVGILEGGDRKKRDKRADMWAQEHF